MQWAGLRSQAPVPTAAWTGPRPRTARCPQGRFPTARRALVASAAASDANSSSNSPGKDEEGEEVVRREKEEKAVASLLMRSQKYAMLKQQLAVAAQFEDYKEAARLRDSLRSFEEKEPVLCLRRLMKKAIEEERFEDAAKYRDELKILAPHSLLKCSSDATTLGIRVQVRSVYIESRSQPLKGQFFFAYRIRITNSSQRPVQLLKRHWIVTDGNGRTENIWGVGVVGEQPVIFPKTGFEYSSACPLSTPNGRMEGDFEMKHIDKAGSSTFNVAIAPFSLSILGDDNDVLL
ncbi:uvrB/uvrC motif family protein [Zea mays]|uniref:Protein ApaG n=1 Tax=Zea mays TaxID=4577 RepID=C0PFK9_MAIZE|nr:uvrB/uvrC motif family protein [Zea mays]ACN33975.1 unknown [Zea mays]|eukprot:NP_001151326.1 uvrB/uvrC motif family protein [Zea mays]